MLIDIPREISVVTERRHVAICVSQDCEYLGFFHKWSYDSYLDKDVALVELVDGRLTYFTMEEIRFLPVGNEIAAEELEKIYLEHGILKGGEQ